MRLHIITIGEPKLAYAKTGWQEYLKRLQRYHSVRVTHLSDKFEHDAKAILQTAGSSYKIALAIEAPQLTSEKLADFLDKRSMEGRELSFIIGGPEGLPAEAITAADFRWSLSQLTFPHDLAMLEIGRAHV